MNMSLVKYPKCALYQIETSNYRVCTSGCGCKFVSFIRNCFISCPYVIASKQELLTVLYLSKSADLRKTDDPFVSNLVKRAKSSGESTLGSTAAQNRLQQTLLLVNIIVNIIIIRRTIVIFQNGDAIQK